MKTNIRNATLDQMAQYTIAHTESRRQLDAAMVKAVGDVLTLGSNPPVYSLKPVHWKFDESPSEVEALCKTPAQVRRALQLLQGEGGQGRMQGTTRAEATFAGLKIVIAFKPDACQGII